MMTRKIVKDAKIRKRNQRTFGLEKEIAKE
jgi:hypothetical protein